MSKTFRRTPQSDKVRKPKNPFGTSPIMAKGHRHINSKAAERAAMNSHIGEELLKFNNEVDSETGGYGSFCQDD